MAKAAAPGRVPARPHYRVQLRFVTEEQLFAPGPLTTPNPKSLRLEVHAAGEEADATVTDGEGRGRGLKRGSDESTSRRARRWIRTQSRRRLWPFARRDPESSTQIQVEQQRVQEDSLPMSPSEDPVSHTAEGEGRPEVGVATWASGEPGPVGGRRRTPPPKPPRPNKPTTSKPLSPNMQMAIFHSMMKYYANVNDTRPRDLKPKEAESKADGVCVFKCLLNRDTECCRVGKESVLITLGYNSALLKFESFAEFSAFSNTLKRCRNDKKKYSVFNQRTEEASATQYFQFYGCISQQQNMMQDFVRTATYHRAILQNHVDFKDKVVLDVGCGTGILSFFAVQAGARRVYAVEASSVAQYAEILVKNNHLSDKIIVLPGIIEEISLPEAVDVIISEPMGYMLFNERMLESYLHSKKWLKANGKMFPTFSDIHLAPFSDDQLYMEHYSRANFWYQQCFYGVNLSSLRAAAVDEYFRQPIVDTFDIRILMARSVKYTVNFMDAKEADLHRVEIPFVFQMTQSGLVHGLAFWFDVAFVGSLVTVWLSTAPTEPLTHWYQVRCLLQTPLFAKEGETLSGRVLFVANKRQSYDIQIVALVNQTGFRSGNILDLKNPFFRFA